MTDKKHTPTLTDEKNTPPMPRDPETVWTKILAGVHKVWKLCLDGWQGTPTARPSTKPGNAAELHLRKKPIPLTAMQYITPPVRPLTPAELEARAQGIPGTLFADTEVGHKPTALPGGRAQVEPYDKTPEYLALHESFATAHSHEGLVDVSVTMIRDAPKDSKDQEFMNGYVVQVDVRHKSIEPKAVPKDVTFEMTDKYAAVQQKLHARMVRVAMTEPVTKDSLKFRRYFTFPKVNQELRELPHGEANFLAVQTVMTKGGQELTDAMLGEQRFGVGGISRPILEKPEHFDGYDVALTYIAFRVNVKSMTEEQLLGYMTKFGTAFFVHQRLSYCPLLQKSDTPHPVFSPVVSGKDPVRFHQEIPFVDCRNWFLASQSKKPIPVLKGWFTLGQQPTIKFQDAKGTDLPETVCLDASKGRMACCLAYTYAYAFRHPIGQVHDGPVPLTHLMPMALGEAPDGRVEYKYLSEDALKIPFSAPLYLFNGPPVGRHLPRRHRGAAPAKAPTSSKPTPTELPRPVK